MKDRLVVYSENMHDHLYISFTLSKLIKSHYDKIFLLLPKKKYLRLIAFPEFNDFVENKQVKIIFYIVNYRLKNKVLNKLFYISTNLINILWLRLIFALYIKQNKKVDLEIIEVTRYTNIYQGLRLHKFDNIRFIIHSTMRFFEDKKTISNFRKPLYDSAAMIYVLHKSLLDNLPEDNKEKKVIPGTFTSKSILDKKSQFLENMSNKLVFTVTGTVDNNIKDYFKITDSFIGLDSKKYVLNFLGKVRDFSVIDYALKNGVNIRYWLDFVQEKEFSETIIKSNYLIYSTSNKEFYSSRVSGIMFDSLRYATPLISDNPYLETNIIDFIYDPKLNYPRELILEKYMDSTNAHEQNALLKSTHFLQKFN